jgi:hypothetical protein
MRRAVLLVTAIATLVEGVAIAGSLLVVSAVIDGYSMSLNGSDPAAARVALWALAGVVGLGFVAVAVLLVTMVVRDRPRRGVIIAATTVQWVLAILAGILTGGWVFAYALGMCGLFMGVLFMEPERPVAAPAPR